VLANGRVKLDADLRRRGVRGQRELDAAYVLHGGPVTAVAAVATVGSTACDPNAQPRADVFDAEQRRKRGLRRGRQRRSLVW
jgi:hypothetical protein